ncbi:MAG: hypothetical protein QOD84_467 [Acidobacteriaceae bacterium]|jgi:hypothetical protein
MSRSKPFRFVAFWKKLDQLFLCVVPYQMCSHAPDACCTPGQTIAPTRSNGNFDCHNSDSLFLLERRGDRFLQMLIIID